MMTLSEIVRIMKCSNATAIARLDQARIPFEIRSPAKTGGRVYYYSITPEAVAELKKPKAKTPQQIADHHGAALSALASMFNTRPGVRR